MMTTRCGHWLILTVAGDLRMPHECVRIFAPLGGAAQR